MFAQAYKIEKNVPYPSKYARKNRYFEYPLASMKIGDSFLVPFTKQKPTSKDIYVPYTKARLLGMELSCRTETKGVRIWRIK